MFSTPHLGRHKKRKLLRLVQSPLPLETKRITMGHLRRIDLILEIVIEVIMIKPMIYFDLIADVNNIY